MLHHVAHVRTDVSEERIISIIKVTRIRVLGTKLAITITVLRVLVNARVYPSSLILVT
jgi:hypothetical protein